MLIQLETQSAKPMPRSVFYSYSHKDEDLRDQLDTHLTLLKREGFISTWHDRKIRPGDEWDHIINDNLNAADVILFLISHDFLASQYCRDVEVRRAMERFHEGKAILIPIILKPCVWTSEDFAKLQVLPKNCRPLVEWPESGFAEVAEELRTMMVDLLYPRKPENQNGGLHGHWILKLKNNPGVDIQARAQLVVSRLRDFTEDFSISLQATATTQIADGEKFQIGSLLILTGTPAAFSKLDKAQRDGKLAPAIGDDILSFYVVHGASVQGSSTVGGSANVAEVEGETLVLRPGKKVSPAYLKGLRLPKGTTGDLEFIFHRGDSDLGLEARKADYQELTDYFHTSLVIKDEFQWVNLSAYEADRMLPPELSGTVMGRNLLSQDCLLKQLTASFMHPDSAVGREYWSAVYAEARRLFGTSKLPFRSFQKVTILPVDSLIYEKDGASEPSEHEPIKVPPDQIMAYVLKNILTVICEEDLVAKTNCLEQARSSVSTAVLATSNSADFTLDLFRRIVLPKLKEEVNEGEHFAEIRRIYSAMLLAAWLKRSLHFTQNVRIRHLADCGDANTSTKFVVRDFVPGALSKAFKLEDVDPAISEAPAFDVPENIEFYAQYVRLFKDGVFRCARNEVGDSPDDRVIRVYFSGAIDLRNLRGTTSISHSVEQFKKSPFRQSYLGKLYVSLEGMQGNSSVNLDEVRDIA